MHPPRSAAYAAKQRFRIMLLQPSLLRHVIIQMGCGDTENPARRRAEGSTCLLGSVSLPLPVLNTTAHHTQNTALMLHAGAANAARTLKQETYTTTKGQTPAGKWAVADKAEAGAAASALGIRYNAGTSAAGHICMCRLPSSSLTCIQLTISRQCMISSSLQPQFPADCCLFLQWLLQLL